MSVGQKIDSYFSNYPDRSYRKGEALIRPGDMPQAHFIAHGIVTQYDIAKNGHKLVLNVFKPGSFIPLANILNDIPSDFFFEATEQTIVHQAPSAGVRNFLLENPEVTFDALSRISRGSNGLLMRLARAMEGDAEGRILQELLIIQSRFLAPGKPISISDTDLATQTGLARETVGRSLKRLDEKGIIRSSRGKVTLLDSLHI